MDTQEKVKLPQCWQDLNDALENGIDRVILFGPSGIGKTYAGMSIGDVEAGAFRLVCTEDMTNMDVTGSFMPDGKGGFQWLNGSALKAWEGNGVKGGRLIVDEIDKASGDVYATLLAMLDSPESASWEHPSTGRIHKPKQNFSAIMTTNVENMGELPTALTDSQSKSELTSHTRTLFFVYRLTCEVSQSLWLTLAKGVSRCEPSWLTTHSENNSALSALLYLLSVIERSQFLTLSELNR